ncbi:restriction endonuclease subunit S [Pseudomonas soli]|uniref:Restriction endonuclease subunit S n=1 Tax=Pseudomonas soli TaxID=1306993 RepID=A0ABU7GV70_9PSED|nr:restriction endonuclease subunit S [Pseudomonas soli]MEE1882866.1 restriction endonuclease subunit S [Pseudomonas soli]
MTALLTDNLPLLAGAPNGIKKLRELILELAVRGKLVSQDPNDEPASELLKRIAEKKAQLVAEGKIKKQKPMAAIAEDEKPYHLPDGWEWVRLPEVYYPVSVSGNRLMSSQISEEGAFPVVDQGKKFVAGYTDDESLLIRLPGPVVVFGDHTTERKYVDFDFVAGADGVKILRPVLLDEKFFWWHLVGLKLEGRGYARHFKVLNDAFFALPPKSEQSRIVAKVDDLMALCNRLEAQQIDAESAHAKLVQALLESLTQASEATNFAASWQLFAEHFHTLFTTEPSIDALKQTLLQLAVMGKLVPQDLNDESGSKLLNRLTQEKTRLVAEGKLKKQKPLVAISEAERPFKIPENWAWSRIGELALSTEYGLSEKTSDLQDGVPVLKMGDIQSGQVLLGEKMKVSKSTEGLPELYLEPEDLLYNRTNSAELVGKTGLFLGPSGEYTFASYLIRVRCPKGLFSPAYLNIAMNAPGFRETQISPHLKQQCGQANVNGTIMKNMIVSVPPMAEQLRIVAKVDELMTLCNQLRNRILKVRQLNEKLTNSLVEHALAEDRMQAPVAIDPQAARILLAAEVTHRLHAQRTFGQRKLQKVVYLAEHAARLASIQGSYLRNVAGPHDRHLMNQVEAGMQKHQWYERVERQTVGHAYRPLSQAGQHREAYNRTWSANEQANIEQVIELMRDWDTDRCEMTVTLYAAWNDFIIEGRPVTDDAIVDEVMHRWNDAKLRFGKEEWRAVLTEMKKHGLLTPIGFGKRTTGGTQTLPGLE